MCPVGLAFGASGQTTWLTRLIPRVTSDVRFMATKYQQSAQTGDQGVAFVQMAATEAGFIYRRFDNADLGIDGAVELLTDSREPSGDIVLAQIKAGCSYVRNGQFFLDADRNHFETWSRYALPVIGIVYEPNSGEARWVNISEHLRQHPESVVGGPFSIEAPASNSFSAASFPQFAQKFRRSVVPATSVSVTPNLLIRPWEPTDAKPTRVLLSLIAADYPNFDAWLTKKLSDPNASKKVVVVGNAIAAFSMWQSKDERNIKLQTFIVGPLYRGTGIGQHLLYHEIRTWAHNPKVERVHVTVASSKADLIDYFKMFGFRVEGFAANRYPRTSAELVMAKHFLRETVRTPAQLQAVADKLKHQFWGLVQGEASRFGVMAADFATQTVFPQLSLTLNRSESTVAPRIQLLDTAGQPLLVHDDESLMREFYPLRIYLRGKRYVLVPIYPEWVNAMLSSSGPHTPLKLRINHAYYCYPRVSNLTKGDLVVFYETKSRGGRGAAIGSAVVQEVMIDTPATLFGNFSNLGIYTLDDVNGHANSRGQSMAIKFALFEPFTSPVSLRSIRRCIGHGTTVQGLTPIPHGAFEQILSKSV